MAWWAGGYDECFFQSQSPAKHILFSIDILAEVWKIINFLHIGKWLWKKHRL